MTKKKKSWKDESGLRKEMEIVKLMKESAKHEHDKCNCEGCYWWTITKTLIKNGRYFYVVESWKDIPVDEYQRIMQRMLQYKIDKKITLKKLVKYLKKQGVPKDKAKAIAEQMLAPVHTVMVGKSPSPLGLLRDM